MKIKIIFVLFLVFVFSLPILFPGESKTNWSAFWLMTIISLVVVVGTITIIKQKSPRTWKEEFDIANRILEDAENGYRPWLSDDEFDLADLTEEELNEYLTHIDKYYRDNYYKEDR